MKFIIPKKPAALGTLIQSAVSVGAQALVPFTEEIREKYTKKTTYGDVYQLFTYVEGQKYCLMPRSLVDRNSIPPGNDHTKVNPVLQLIASKPPQNEEQAATIQDSISLLKQGRDHIFEAPTGFGKTYCGCAIANGLGQATLIIVTKNDLVKGWHDTLLNLIGVDPKEIGHVQQKTQTYKGCRFVVAMIQSLVKREYDDEFYRHFGLIIFDEVHRLGAEYFAQVCNKFPARYRLGLSATPKRGDGKELLFQAHIGPVLVKGSWIPMSPKILVKKTGWKLPMEHRRDPITNDWVYKPMNFNPGQPALVHKAMAESYERNMEIVEFVLAAYQKGRKGLVLSTMIEAHLKVLFHMLVKAGVPGNDIAYYIGGLKAVDIQRAKEVPVVLGTYLMVGEGTNVPHWDYLVMATPASKVKQPVGRVLRFLEGKPKPVVLDLVDNDAILKGYYLSRLKEYYQLQAEVVEI